MKVLPGRVSDNGKDKEDRESTRQTATGNRRLPKIDKYQAWLLLNVLGYAAHWHGRKSRRMSCFITWLCLLSA